MQEARYYEKLADADSGKVQCHLCPKRCTINDGKRGFCRARENRGGTLYSATYGRVTSIAMDPIEKKPLYHFYPQTQILSLGANGCNFACDFCQNWHISQGEAPTRDLSPDQAVQVALRESSIGIAYTYNEPFIGYEYVFDTARLAKEQNLKNVLVTNGYVNPEPLDEILPFIDALNIDVKSINPDFYKERCKGTLEPVLHTCVRAKRSALVEITNLIIPGHNDSPHDLHGLAEWVVNNLGDDTPVHLSAYTPRYRLQAPPTPETTLKEAYQIFKDKGLFHVYIGNLHSDVGSNTYCRHCGAELISRWGYRIKLSNLEPSASVSEGLPPRGKCKECGKESDIVME